MNACRLSKTHQKQTSRLLVSAWLVASIACGETAKQPLTAGTGPNPVLPEPNKTLIPTVKIAKAVGWPEGRMPTPALGMKVVAFAKNLDHPRWLYVLPNGDVLVAESNAPPKAEGKKGIKAVLMKSAMKKAGAGTPSANRISLLRDANRDGIAESKFALLENLNSPFGMALVGNELFVANADALVKFPYTTGTIRITEAAKKVIDLPGGPINHHWTKGLIASADGKKLYVAIGSNSNVAERGMVVEAGRAAIWEVDIATQSHRIFASGLRNPVGMAWEPVTGALWTSVNERDELGSDLVPDYMTSVRDGGFYGWPYSYYGQHVDTRVKPPRPDLVAKAIVPDYALGPHTSSLGLTSSKGNQLPAVYAQGMFVGQHGSWNRKPPSGYKVIFVAFDNGKPVGTPIDVLTGFLSEKGEAYGRPVGVAIDKQGSLLVADDVGNIIWRVSQ